jgi:hypothetical protein
MGAERPIRNAYSEPGLVIPDSFLAISQKNGADLIAENPGV